MQVWHSVGNHSHLPDPLSLQRTSAASVQDFASTGNFSAPLGGATQKDVTGGWLLGSDPVKYGMPLATSASMLAWSMLEFPQGYREAGVFDESLQSVLAAATYMLNNLDTTGPTGTVFIAQVRYWILFLWSRPCRIGI